MCFGLDPKHHNIHPLKTVTGFTEVVSSIGENKMADRFDIHVKR